MIPATQHGRDSQPPPSHGVAHSAFELLELVDALLPGSTGELIVELDGRAIGSIYVEDSRVCWIAARGLARRLSDLLRARARPPMGGAEIEAAFRRGVRERRPLGELLVDAGLLGSHDLREALLAHSIESLGVLGQRRVTTHWVRRRERRFDATFTFDTGELAVAIGASIAGRSTRSVDLATLDGIAWAVTFVRGAGHARALPVAHIGEPTTARALGGLARWSAAVDDLARGVEARPRFLVFGPNEQGGGLVVWSSGPKVQVASASERFAFARLVSRVSEATG